MTLSFMIFVWLFAVLGRSAKSQLRDLAGHAGRWLVAIGVAGWVAGALIQIATYGVVTTPALQ